MLRKIPGLSSPFGYLGLLGTNPGHLWLLV